MGSSALTPGTFWGTNYTATWTITATGALGAALPVNWMSKTTANDPTYLSSSDFSSVTTPTYNLFFAAGLGAGSGFSPNGSINLNATYATASGTTTVLDITMDASGVTVTNDGVGNLTFYQSEFDR